MRRYIMTVEAFNALCKECKNCEFGGDCILSEHKGFQKLIGCKVGLDNCPKIGRAYTLEELDAEF